jgi:hypothetical protein
VNLKEGFGKKKIRYCLGADERFQEFDIACSVKACLITSFLNMGYKELNIPANSDGTHKLDKNSFIFGLEDYMLIALPNLDGSFTCTLFMPFEGKTRLIC